MIIERTTSDGFRNEKTVLDTHAMHWLTKGFLLVAACSLLITASAKFISAFGTEEILNTLNVVFPIKMKSFLLLAATVEYVVAFVLLSKISTRIKILALLWVALSFFLYKLSLWIIDAPSPCPCLGTVTASIGISPNTAAMITDGLIAYYLTGSLSIIILRQGNRKLS